MIVAESGSSTGSFYAHFKNKEDVFAAALEVLGQKIFEVLEWAKAAETDPSTAIKQGIEVLFLYLAENPLEARILIVESSGLSPRLEQVRRGILRQHEELVRKRIESAPEFFAPTNAVISGRCLVGAVFEALCSWMEESPESRLPAAEVARVVGDFTMRALARG
jgi:AcrR family transcriptional regulator